MLFLEGIASSAGSISKLYWCSVDRGYMESGYYSLERLPAFLLGTRFRQIRCVETYAQ